MGLGAIELALQDEDWTAAERALDETRALVEEWGFRDYLAQLEPLERRLEDRST